MAGSRYEIGISSSPVDPRTTCVKRLTTPGERTNISGVLVFESSTTELMSNTGGSTNLQTHGKYHDFDLLHLPKARFIRQIFVA